MKQISLPDSVRVIKGPRGPRFRGPATALRELAELLRLLKEEPVGFVCNVGPFELYVTDSPNDAHAKGRIALPRHAWNILASKFIEVTAGMEESPFDFGDCGYLYPRPDPDLGVELIGEPEEFAK